MGQSVCHSSSKWKSQRHHREGIRMRRGTGAMTGVGVVVLITYFSLPWDAAEKCPL